MPQDSSSINNLLLPNDSLSHFKAFVRMQDEVPAVFFTRTYGKKD